MTLFRRTPSSGEGTQGLEPLPGSAGLDRFYIPTRYPDSYPEGTPGEHFGRLQSEQALVHAGAIVSWVRAALASPG